MELKQKLVLRERERGVSSSTRIKSIREISMENYLKMINKKEIKSLHKVSIKKDYKFKSIDNEYTVLKNNCGHIVGYEIDLKSLHILVKELKKKYNDDKLIEKLKEVDINNELRIAAMNQKWWYNKHSTFEQKKNCKEAIRFCLSEIWKIKNGEFDLYYKNLVDGSFYNNNLYNER